MKRLVILFLAMLIASCQCKTSGSHDATFLCQTDEVYSTLTTDDLPEPPHAFMAVGSVHFGLSSSDTNVRPHSRVNPSTGGRHRYQFALMQGFVSDCYNYHPVTLSGIHSTRSYFISLGKLRI